MRPVTSKFPLMARLPTSNLDAGHEPWDLFSSEEFAEELKHRSASSTSSGWTISVLSSGAELTVYCSLRLVQPIAGSAKKGQANKVEIMCQGARRALPSSFRIAYAIVLKARTTRLSSSSLLLEAYRRLTSTSTPQSRRSDLSLSLPSFPSLADVPRNRNAFCSRAVSVDCAVIHARS